MKNKIIIYILIIILLFVSGCKNNQLNNISSISVSTIMVSEPANTAITNDSQLKYQYDYSDILEELYTTKKIKNTIFGEYGLETNPTVSSINDKNTMYKIELQCNSLNKNDCIDAHNLYNSELLNIIKDIYYLDARIVDSATISK